jgi:hypothetical protein
MSLSGPAEWMSIEGVAACALDAARSSAATAASPTRFMIPILRK